MAAGKVRKSNRARRSISDVVVVRVHRAEPLTSVSAEVAKCTISVGLDISDDSGFDADVDAGRIVTALARSLPGSTLDRVVVKLLERSVSQLRVSRVDLERRSRS